MGADLSKSRWPGRFAPAHRRSDTLHPHHYKRLTAHPRMQKRKPLTASLTMLSSTSSHTSTQVWTNHLSQNTYLALGYDLPLLAPPVLVLTYMPSSSGMHSLMSSHYGWPPTWSPF